MARAKSVDPAEVQFPSPANATTARPFPFLDLRTELRVCIYRLLFTRESQIWLTGHRAHHSGRGWGDRIEIGLLLSCRKVYDEASPVLYDTNKFAVNGLAGSKVILQRLGTQACSYMKRLKIWSRPLHLSELEGTDDSNGDLFRGKEDLRVRKAPIILSRTPLTVCQIDRSVWDCVSHHLQNLETIELGSFNSVEDFSAAISRFTSSPRLVDRRRPPPTIELEVYVHGSTSPFTPETRDSAPGHIRKGSPWLPPVRSIRLIGHHSSIDFLRRQVPQHYRVSSVEHLEVGDLRSEYTEGSAVLITLSIRPQSTCIASRSDKEADVAKREK
jgi:hypothetical protein